MQSLHPQAPPHEQSRRATAGAHPPAHRFVALLAAFVAALAVVTAADAEIVTRQDNQGRTMTFDVRTEGADVEFYANLLRWATHGDEIADVRVRIVDPVEVQGQCGAAALACYGMRRGIPTIVMPSGTGTVIAETMLHEYGHHLDTAWDVEGVPDLEGTPVWWNARGMAALLANGMVAFDYSRGWNRSVAEIFAEDYSYIHLGGSYAIPWLEPPDEALRTAMFAELGGAPTAAPPTEATIVAPLVITRAGRIAARRRVSVPFGLLGPGRHVTLTVNLSGSNRAGIRARAEIVCNNNVVARQTFGRRRVQRVLNIPSIGPAECQARVVSTTGVALDYTMRLRLAVES
jgi:hypothetical protein